MLKRRESQNLGNHEVFLKEMAWTQNFMIVVIPTSGPNYEIPVLIQFYYKFHVKSLKKCFSPITFLN